MILENKFFVRIHSQDSSNVFSSPHYCIVAARYIVSCSRSTRIRVMERRKASGIGTEDKDNTLVEPTVKKPFSSTCQSATALSSAVLPDTCHAHKPQSPLYSICRSALFIISCNVQVKAQYKERILGRSQIFSHPLLWPSFHSLLQPRRKKTNTGHLTKEQSKNCSSWQIRLPQSWLVKKSLLTSVLYSTSCTKCARYLKYVTICITSWRFRMYSFLSLLLRVAISQHQTIHSTPSALLLIASFISKSSPSISVPVFSHPAVQSPSSFFLSWVSQKKTFLG